MRSLMTSTNEAPPEADRQVARVNSLPISFGMARIALMLAALAGLAAGSGAVAAQDAAGAPAANTKDPSQLVQTVAESFLKDLETHREAYRKDPQALRQAVDKDVLPFFDMQYSARLVLGRHWREANPDQRQSFVDAFENSMLENYGNALVEFKSDRLRVLPTRTDPGATNAIVRSTIRRDDGSTVPVNYVMHQTAQGWKAWDVIIEGISYVKSFRDDFGAQIDKEGIDSVIQRLQRGERPKTPGGQEEKKS